MSDYTLSVIADNGDTIVLYEPDAALHQDDFHASVCANVLALGPRGTGKSTQLRFDAILRCLMIPDFRALILRRTMPQLRESHLNYIEREMKLLGGYFLKTTHTAVFPNGSTLVFAHCETEADILNFLSSQYGFIGFDELSTFSLNQFLQISAACRAPMGAPYRAVVRAGSNPLGEGAEWMEHWFCLKDVDPAEFPQYNPADYEMIFSRLEDNKHLDTDSYIKRLQNLPEHMRRAWLLGEFVMEGAYFTDFRKKTEEGKPWHVIDMMPDLKGAIIYRALDWGWHDPTVMLWIAVYPDSRCIVFKEKSWVETPVINIVPGIKTASTDMRIAETFVDPTVFANSQATGSSVGDLFQNYGIPLTLSKNDRSAAGFAIHEYLNTILPDGKPKLQLYSFGCPELIRTFPKMRMDKTDPSRIADGADHHVITLSYYCMAAIGYHQSQVRKPVPQWMKKKFVRRRYT